MLRMHVQGRTDVDDALPAGDTAGAGGAAAGDEAGGGADEGGSCVLILPNCLLFRECWGGLNIDPQFLISL